MTDPRRLPALFVALWAAFMAADVIIFRDAEAYDPGRTLRHGLGSGAVAGLALAIRRGRRGAWLAAVIVSGLFAALCHVGSVAMLLGPVAGMTSKGYPIAYLRIAIPVAAVFLTAVFLVLVHARHAYRRAGPAA